ncbi:hypothetical protein WN48_07200 [Eufriesea mexicana]|uniref:Uncharacterized protein n=1 Tax=Eufriesea mexicana TaxID=516756 RepID=A0A310SRM0_9HYME|nr:hypothetical protein WN48_07200 [Eufriesea mexicana]
MVLEPGGGLSFPLPPGSGSTGSGGSLLTPARLFQRATPVFPFHLTGWPPHHPVLGQVQSQVQQTMQAQHQAAAAAVRFLSHHHPHHPHPALGNHPLVPAITSHHPTAHHLHHGADHVDEDDEKKAEELHGIAMGREGRSQKEARDDSAAGRKLKWKSDNSPGTEDTGEDREIPLLVRLVGRKTRVKKLEIDVMPSVRRVRGGETSERAAGWVSRGHSRVEKGQTKRDGSG